MSERNDKGQFGSKYTLTQYDDLHNDYAEWVMQTVDKKTTLTRLKDDTRIYLHWCEQRDDYHPYDATADDIRLYIRYLIKSGNADTTVNRRFATVSKYYHTLATDPSIEGISENPCADISLPKDFDIGSTSEYVHIIREDGRDDIIAPDYKQLKPLFEHAPGSNPATQTRNELLCRLAWMTAMRADELSRVRIDNIDYDKREIKIRSSKLKPKNELYTRRVWWEPSLDLLMRRWDDFHREQLNKRANDEYLFIGAHNGHEPDDEYNYQLKPSTISRIVKRAANNAGIQEPLSRKSNGDVKQWLYTAHRLRHSRITHLCNKVDGLSIHFVRMMAGHERIDTTLKYVRNDWDEARNQYHEAVKS